MLHWLYGSLWKHPIKFHKYNLMWEIMKTSMINGEIQSQEKSVCPTVQNRMVTVFESIIIVVYEIVSDTFYWFIIQILKFQKLCPGRYTTTS